MDTRRYEYSTVYHREVLLRRRRSRQEVVVFFLFGTILCLLMMKGPKAENLKGFTIKYRGKNIEQSRESLVAVCSRSCESWKGAKASDPEIQTVQVRGGITNLLYLVVDTRISVGKPRSLLVRIYGERTDRLIDREKDVGIVKALSRCGVREFLNNEGKYVRTTPTTEVNNALVHQPSSLEPHALPFSRTGASRDFLKTTVLSRSQI